MMCSCISRSSACLLLIIISGSFTSVFAQQLDFRGYIKELGSISTGNDLKPIRYDNILHHRHETHLSFDNGLELRADLRTRLLAGWTVENTPGYSDFLEQDPGYFDLSRILIESDRSLLHTTVDRLQLSYYSGLWEVSLGRQRINWGKSFVWNPNDLFNAYAYLDFDYEERPGTDAASVSYNWSYASSVQLGYRIGDSVDESVIAGMFRGNIGAYDVQIIAGSYYEQWVLGGGFSGYLKDSGLYGEVSYFHEKKDLKNNRGHITATLGADHMFRNAVYLSGELLYNGGYNTVTSPLLQLTTPPTADNLFISKSGIYLNSSYQLSPLTTLSGGFLSSFTESVYILIPQISYSVSENMDLLVLAQVFRGTLLDGVTETPNLLFFRLKWSY